MSKLAASAAAVATTAATGFVADHIQFHVVRLLSLYRYISICFRKKIGTALVEWGVARIETCCAPTMKMS